MRKNWRILGTLAVIGVMVGIFAPLAVANSGGTPNRSPVPACTISNGNAPDKNPHCRSSYPPPPPSCKPDNDVNGDLHQAATHNNDGDCDADNQPGPVAFNTTGNGGTGGGVTVGMALGFLVLLTTGGVVLRRRRLKSLRS